jgi:hypothetical protein
VFEDPTCSILLNYVWKWKRSSNSGLLDYDKDEEHASNSTGAKHTNPTGDESGNPTGDRLNKLENSFEIVMWAIQ